MNWRRFLFLPVFVFAFTTYSQGQVKLALSDFQCPGGSGTFATGLNDSGQVVGWVGSFENGQGFTKKKNGPCESLPMVTGSLATIPLGINDPGQIVGIAITEDKPNGSGFLYEKGVYTLLDYPDPETCQTYAFSINNRGQIVGLYDLWKAGNGGPVCDGPDQPFLREPDGTFVTLPKPSDAADSAQANGINVRGMIIGNYIINAPCGDGECVEDGYLNANGTIRSIELPAAWLAKDTMPTGINPQGQIVGRYFTEPTLEPIGPCHGFFMDSIDATPVELTYPGAEFTCIGAINAPGEVSGAAQISGQWRSFVIDLKALLPAAE